MANPFNLTEYRKAVHERYTALLETREGNVLMPALDLAKSLRSLNGGQLAVLDRLLRVFAEHPLTSDEFRLVAMLQAELVKHDG